MDPFIPLPALIDDEPIYVKLQFATYSRVYKNIGNDEGSPYEELQADVEKLVDIEIKILKAIHQRGITKFPGVFNPETKSIIFETLPGVELTNASILEVEKYQLISFYDPECLDVQTYENFIGSIQ
jgi:hypothetical protein